MNSYANIGIVANYENTTKERERENQNSLKKALV